MRSLSGLKHTKPVEIAMSFELLEAACKELYNSFVTKPLTNEELRRLKWRMAALEAMSRDGN